MMSDFPQHLIRLADSPWGLWRWVGLRGAGFPIDTLLKLAAPECAAAADRFLQAEAEAQRARDTALAAAQARMENAEGEQRRLLAKAIKDLKRDRLPGAANDIDISAEIEAYQAANTRAESAWDEFEQAYAQATGDIAQAIYEIASLDRFREAITWQNRHAIHTGIDALLRKGGGTAGRDGKSRQHEALVASYLQRYCAKNDTIGFFGPIGWARLSSDGAALTAQPGRQLLDVCNVYLEAWGVQRLAETLAKDAALRPWLTPRLLPFIDIDGASLYMPFKEPIHLSEQNAAILRACDGERTAQQLADTVLEMPASKLANREEVYSVLERMRERNLIAWTLEVPIEPHAEQVLRRQLQRIGDEALRRSCLGRLDALEAARDALARAAGDAAAVDQALEDLEATFTRLTGMASTRASGKTYAGRTLAYVDCRRDIDLEIGPALIEGLEAPLSLLLTSARWHTSQVAALYRKAFVELYADLTAKTGASSVDAVTFWQHVQPLVLNKKERLAYSLVPALEQRWAEALAVPPGQRRVKYTSAELRPRVEAAFAIPDADRWLTHYHSPDLMIAAESAEAIRRGDYEWVMGEFHPAANTLGGASFLPQHPRLAEILETLDADMARPRIVLAAPYYSPGRTTRTTMLLKSPRDIILIASPEVCGVPRSQALPIGSLVVEQGDDGLQVCTRDRQLRFDIMHTFADLIAILIFDSFTLRALHAGDYTPRINFDRLIVCRESWRFTPADLPFIYDKSESRRFAAARRWMHMHGMPRFVFVKASVEDKPFYVDFDSPIYIDSLAKTARRTIDDDAGAPVITVTEMLPNPDQTWLADTADRRYTSELRCVVVDTEVC